MQGGHLRVLVNLSEWPPNGFLPSVLKLNIDLNRIPYALRFSPHYGLTEFVITEPTKFVIRYSLRTSSFVIMTNRGGVKYPADTLLWGVLRKHPAKRFRKKWNILRQKIRTSNIVLQTLFPYLKSKVSCLLVYEYLLFMIPLLVFISYINHFKDTLFM